MAFAFDVVGKKISILGGAQEISAIGVLEAYQTWLINNPAARGAEILMELLGGVPTVGTQKTPILLMLSAGVRIVLDAAILQGKIIPLTSQILSKDAGLNFWEISGAGVAVVPGYGNVTTITQEATGDSRETFDASAIYDDERWAMLMAKIGGTVATVNIETNNLAIDGLTAQDITLTQGEDWELEVSYPVASGSTVEFLLDNDWERGGVISGGVSIHGDFSGFVLSLSHNQTAALHHVKYFYNVFVSSADGGREQVMRGTAKIMKSVMLE